MKKWEYLTAYYNFDNASPQKIDSILNSYGEKGWEMVSYINKKAIFKRVKKDK